MIWERGRRVTSAALLILAILLGGGHSPSRALLLELVAIGLLALTLLKPGLPGGREAIPALALVALIVTLPLLQLIPLPFDLWAAFPGHAIPDNIVRSIGASGMARPLSLDPDDTREAAAMLLPPVAIFVSTLQSSIAERALFMLIIAIGAATSLMIGLAQHPGGIDFYLYAGHQHIFPIGLFANHNQQADFLIIGMLSVMPLAVGGNHTLAVRFVAGTAFFAFAIGVLATASRMGLALLLVPFGLYAGLLLERSTGARLRFFAIGTALIVAPVYAIVTQSGVAQQSLARFDSLSDERPVFWRTTLKGISATFPTGTGIGTFVPAYQLYERPEDISDFYVNHAHNDYLELIFEGGAVAAVLLVAYLILLGSRVLSADARPEHLAAIGGIAVLLAHSLVDYPLRMTSLAVIFALLNAFLFAPSTPRRRGRRATRQNPKNAHLAQAAEPNLKN